MFEIQDLSVLLPWVGAALVTLVVVAVVWEVRRSRRRLDAKFDAALCTCAPDRCDGEGDVGLDVLDPICRPCALRPVGVDCYAIVR